MKNFPGSKRQIMALSTIGLNIALASQIASDVDNQLNKIDDLVRKFQLGLCMNSGKRFFEYLRAPGANSKDSKTRERLRSHIFSELVSIFDEDDIAFLRDASNFDAFIRKVLHIPESEENIKIPSRIKK